MFPTVFFADMNQNLKKRIKEVADYGCCDRFCEGNHRQNLYEEIEELVAQARSQALGEAEGVAHNAWSQSMSRWEDANEQMDVATARLESIVADVSGRILSGLRSLQHSPEKEA